MKARFNFNIISFEVMEIARIRKELTELLDNIIEHSNKYTDDRTIPSLEVGAILTKINRLQEKMAVLKHVLQVQEKEIKYKRQQEKMLDKQAVTALLEAESIEVSTPKIPVVDEDPIELVPETVVAIEENKTVEKEVQPEVTKLMDSLTLNDRYLYANELFNKDMSAFNELVKTIDTCTSFDEVQKLFVALDWEIDNEHVVSFISIVERRFY
jgi:formiminotetrahydrofolate cyclodeaminase